MPSVATDLAAAASYADERDRVRRGIGILVGASILFGIMAVCVRVAGRELPAMPIAFVRFLGSFVLLFGVARGRGLRPQPGNLVRVLARGALGWAAIACYFEAIQRIGASLATIVQCTYPLATAVIAVLVLGEAVSVRLVAALLVSVSGLVLAFGPSATLAGVSPVGVGFGLAGAGFAGAAVATAQHLRNSEDASLITVYFMAVGTVLTAPFLLGGVPVPSPGTALALVGVVVTSAAGQWLLHHGLGFTTASLGSLASATSVLTAAGLEAAFLGARLPWWSLAGGALMIAAVGLAASGRRA